MSSFPFSTDTKFKYDICNPVGRYNATTPSNYNNIGTYVKPLLGVFSEPIFVSKINQGPGMVKLEINHFPSEIAFGQLIRITYPDGEVHGFYQYEGRVSRQAKTQRYEITLTPLAAQLKDTDFGSTPSTGGSPQPVIGYTQSPSRNYSTDATQPGSALGPVALGVPVTAGLLLTKNLCFITNGLPSTPQSYTYNQATVWDTLDTAVKIAGPGYYWYCDPLGQVTISNTPRYTHVLSSQSVIASGEWADDTLSLFNGQPVSGGIQADSGHGATVTYANSGTTIGGVSGVGVVADSSKSAIWNTIIWNPSQLTGTGGVVGTLIIGAVSYEIDHNGPNYITVGAPFAPLPAAGTAYSVSSGQTIYAFAQDNSTNQTTNPYSTAFIGKRTAPVYSDTSITNQTTLNALAESMLQYGERVAMVRTLQISHYLSQPSATYGPGTPPRFQPGDAIYYQESFPDPTLIGPSATVGPYLITDVTEYGGTGKFEIVVSADNTVPLHPFNPGLGTAQAIRKLQQNSQ